MVCHCHFKFSHPQLKQTHPYLILFSYIVQEFLQIRFHPDNIFLISLQKFQFYMKDINQIQAEMWAFVYPSLLSILIEPIRKTSIFFSAESKTMKKTYMVDVTILIISHYVSITFVYNANGK